MSNGGNEELSSEAKLQEFVNFVIEVIDKRKHLEKFIKGVKGVRENAVKQDRLLVKQVREFIEGMKKEASKVKIKDKGDIEALINSIAEKTEEYVAELLKSRRMIDKYFDTVVNNLANAVIQHDERAINAIASLLANIQNEHDKEIEKLKVQLADAITTIDDLKQQVEALRQGRRPKPSEIPTVESGEYITIRCPICHQEWDVPKGTREYKCGVCGHMIVLDEEGKVVG